MTSSKNINKICVVVTLIAVLVTALFMNGSALGLSETGAISFSYVSSYDAVAIILSEKTPFQFRWCRIFTDLCCVGIGFVCGANVGIGTVITAFCMGPFTQWCCDHFAKPLLARFDS